MGGCAAGGAWGAWGGSVLVIERILRKRLPSGWVHMRVRLAEDLFPSCVGRDDGGADGLAAGAG